MSQEKKVDESWKISVEKERRAPGPTQETAGAAAHSDFLGFISTLAMQVMIGLGEVAHPQTGQPEPDLAQARYLIDIIQLLSEKTKGNLSKEEEREMQTLLYELRVKFVKKSKEIPQS